MITVDKRGGGTRMTVPVLSTRPPVGSWLVGLWQEDRKMDTRRDPLGMEDPAPYAYTRADH